LWIGPAEGLGSQQASQTPSLDVTWVRDAAEALALSPSSVDAFDVALLDSDAHPKLPDVRRLGSRPRFPPLVVRLPERAASKRPQLLAAGAAEVLVVSRAKSEVERSRAREELLRQISAVSLRRTRHAPAVDDAQAELAFGGARPDAGLADRFEGLVARSPAMEPLLALVERARHSLATVLLTGETGTGKEVVARAIHSGGPRKGRPFVAVNCAAFPEALLESELFGHKRGSFTGAHRDKQGLFEAANGGTLFLDEVGETAAPLQAKLLRALQEREVRPVGASRARRVNVRVIAATNRSLKGGPASEAFRRDLYYRLAVFPIAIPPLRKRVRDIVPLAEHFLALHGRREAKEKCTLSKGATRVLLAHNWPGNVRELENEMQRALALVERGDTITADALSSNVSASLAPIEANVVDGDSLRDNLHRVEAWMIRRTLEEQGGHRTATARELGITRAGIYKKMKRLGIE
jgi:Nif-specific regulatory protein